MNLLLLLITLARAASGTPPEATETPDPEPAAVAPDPEPIAEPVGDPEPEPAAAPEPAPSAPEAIAPEPAAPEPASPEAIAPEPTAPEPAAPEPASPEAIAPEPAAPEPEPGTPEPAATAPEPEPTAPEPAAEPTPQQALDEARQSYFEGEHHQALQLFLALRDRLARDGETDDEVYVETMLYLGEVQYLLDDRVGAWNTFETLLGHRPDVSMSTFNHPRDVVHWFELVKQRVQQKPVPVPDPVLPPPPLPAWAFVPFGTPQFLLGHNGRGVSFAVLQASFGAASIGTWVYLARVNGPNHPSKWTDEQTKRRVNVIRYAVQWPATAAFYGLWAVSLLDARHTWKIEHPRPVNVGLIVGPTGPGLVLDARF